MVSKNKTSSKPVSLAALLGNGAGDLGAKSIQVLTVQDIGKQIQAGLGVHIDNVNASEVVIVGMLIDDSGSIESCGNTQVIRDGVNSVLEALGGSKQEDNILIYMSFLNNGILYPVGPLSGAPKLNTKNYNEKNFRNTPLYDQTTVILGTMAAKAMEFAQNAVPTRTVTLIVTDGADYGSRDAKPKDINLIVKDMQKTEMHIVAAMGIDDGGQTDFKDVFSKMGIADKWILTPQNDKHAIREAFQLFSKSAVAASKTAGTFSKLALGGGFGNP